MVQPDDSFGQLVPSYNSPRCSLQPQDLDFDGVEFEEACRSAAEDTDQRLLLLVDKFDTESIEEALAKDEDEAKRVVALARRQLRRERLQAGKRRRAAMQAPAAYAEEFPITAADVAPEDTDDAICAVRAEIQAKELEATSLNETIAEAERRHALAAQELRELRNEVKQWCDTVASLEAAEDEKATHLRDTTGQMKSRVIEPVRQVSPIQTELGTSPRAAAVALSPRTVLAPHAASPVGSMSQHAPSPVGSMSQAVRTIPATVSLPMSTLIPPAPASPPATLKTLTTSASMPTTLVIPATMGSSSPAQSPGGSPRGKAVASSPPRPSASQARVASPTQVRQVSLTGSVSLATGTLASERPRLRMPLGVSRSERHIVSPDRLTSELRPSPRGSTPRLRSPRQWSPRPGTALSLTLGSGQRSASLETPKILTAGSPDAVTVQLRRGISPKAWRAEPKRRVASPEQRRSASAEPHIPGSLVDQSTDSSPGHGKEETEQVRVVSRSPPPAPLRSATSIIPNIVCAAGGASVSSTAGMTPISSYMPTSAATQPASMVSRNPTPSAPMISPAPAASPPLALRGTAPIIIQHRVMAAGAAPTMAASVSVPQLAVTPGRHSPSTIVPPVALAQTAEAAGLGPPVSASVSAPAAAAMTPGRGSARASPPAALSQPVEVRSRPSGFLTPSGVSAGIPKAATMVPPGSARMASGFVTPGGFTPPGGAPASVVHAKMAPTTVALPLRANTGPVQAKALAVGDKKD